VETPAGEEGVAMDPDAALTEARKALQLYLRRYSDKGTGLYEADNLANAFEALDDWLSHGGFLPKAWEKRKKA